MSGMTSANAARSDSVSSTDSNMSNPGSTTTNRRQSSSGLYASLNAQKRSDDPASMARRQSMNDQRPKTGFLGQMWNNYVRGSGSP